MIDPVAFTLFSLEVRWYGISYAISFIFTYFFVLHFSRDLSLKKDQVENLFFYTVIFGLIGGRLGYILFYNFSFYLSNPLQMFAVWNGGMSVHGAIIAGLITIIYFSRKHKINFLKITDLFVIPISLGFAFGRLANYVNQEIVGKITSSSLGVVFPLHDDQTRWPSQLFESVKNMITFQVLLYLKYKKQLKAGTLTALFFIIYSFGRFLIDFFRTPTIDLGLISLGQLLSLLFGLFGLYLLYKINND